MIKMKKDPKKWLKVLIVLTLALIWGHSLMSPEQSSEESNWFLQQIRPFLEFFLGKGNVTEHLVRKMAHFCEFALLGGELLAYFSLSYGNGAKLRCLSLAVAHGLFAALTDESVQLLSSRGSQVQDVWLDTAGAVFGAGAMLLLMTRLAKKKRKT